MKRNKKNLNYLLDNVKNEVEYMLSFLEIPDKYAFSLRELDESIKACKIMDIDIEPNELLKIFKKLTDIIYINGGAKFLFNILLNSSELIFCSKEI